MKTITKSIITALLIVTMGSSVLADGRRGYYSPGGHRHHPPARHHDSGWVAPLLFLGLAGAVIGAAASQQSAPPATYVVPPPAYVPPPVNYLQPPPAVYAAPPPQPANPWYFCRSVGQYYPYTQYCPEGWQQVAPTPPSY